MVAATALAAGWSTPAQAFMHFGAASVLAQLASVTDVTAAPDTQLGVVTGAVVKTQAGTLKCEVWVNGAPKTDVRSHTIGTDPVHVAVVAGQATYHAEPWDNVTICAIFTYDNTGTSEWWAEDQGGPTSIGKGSWQPMPVDPDRCALVRYSYDPNPLVCPVLLTIDSRLGTPLADIWQDCGPYSPLI